MTNAVHDGPTDATLALRALRAWPDREAFRWDGGAMTRAHCLALIARMQAVLQVEGFGRGDRVALLSSNWAEAWCLVIAVQALGGGVCNLHPLGALADQALQVDELCPAFVIVCGLSHATRAEELALACPGARHLRLGGGGDDLLALAAREAATDPLDLSQPELPGTLNFTGGTTGRPKPVSRSAGALAAITRTILSDFGLPEAPRYLAVAPISHVGGTKIVPVLLKGGTVHLMTGFDPDAVLATIARERITLTLMVPTMIYALLDRLEGAAQDLSSLQLLLYGAAPMSPARLAEGIARLGPIFAQLYGQTECYPIALLDRADHDPTQPRTLASCGRVVSSAQVVLLRADGSEAPEGEPGEICVRAPMVMSGYMDRPEETAQTLAGGWLHTGDVAIRDAEGRLTIVDRLKDMIVTGGFNVYPKEIEDVLTADDSVSAAAVIGVPDAKWGEAVVGFVVPRPGRVPDVGALLAAVQAAKGPVSKPKRLEVVESLPMTALGKIDKKALRARFWQGAERQV
ncbi:AMP-binding protein [Cereibacter sphaeroides]|nr:AMP-binding protein [Cereibacter sphaeroides]